MSKSKPVVRSGEIIPHFDGSNDANFFKLEFWNRIIAVCNAVLNCKAFKVSENNLFINAGTSTAGSSVQMFAITALTGGDYFTARALSNFRPVDGIPSADLIGNDVKIAKPPTIRRSITGEFIDGTNINYRDAVGTDDGFADNNRIANDGSQDESQCVYPRFITITGLGFTSDNPIPLTCQAVIYAAQMTGAAGVFDADGKALDWLEIEPARVWAKRFNT